MIAMKKTVSLSMAFLFAALMACSFTSCSSSQDFSMNIQVFAQNVMDNVSFDDQLESIDKPMINDIFLIDDNTDAVMYAGAGGSADVFVVFAAANAAGVKNVRASVDKYIETNKAAVANYTPAELDKLNNAILVEKGKYLAFCVTNDPNAKSVIEQYMK